jgi:hypothetical protein
MSVFDAPASPIAQEAAGTKSILKKAISFPAFLGALLVAGVFVPARTFFVDPDVWWHIKVGASILANHHWPVTDPYSFTASGSPWIAYEWLGEVLLAAVNHAGGLVGLAILEIALSAALVLGLYIFATVRCGNCKAAFVACAPMLVLAGVSFTLRPQMIGYFFLVLTLIVLERFRQGHARAIWLLPPLFMLWVNTHGSFVFGLLTLGVYWASGMVRVRWGDLESKLWTAGERLRLAVVFLLSLIAITITPYGTRLAAYPVDMAFAQPVNVANVQEWKPMPFNLFYGKLFLALLLGFLLAQIALRLTWRLEEFTLVLVGTAVACLHARFVMIFVPFFVPLLAVLLARWVPAYEARKDPFALNAMLMALIAAGMVWFFPSQAKLRQAVADYFPVRALEYVGRYSVPRPMFNTYYYGGYLVWSLDGPNKVFIDGRGDFYERAGVFADYLSITNVRPDALALLRTYNVQSCLIKREEPLGTLLSASPGWQRVYEDKISALFVRKRSNR